MKKILLFLVLFVFVFAPSSRAQVSNVQVASGPTPDVTKPATGFNFPSAFVLNVKTGATINGAGTIDMTSGKFVLPNSASPTTSSFGAIAGANAAWASGRGAPQFYDGTANVYLIGALASSTPTNGQVPVWNTGGTVTWSTVPGLSSSPTLTGIWSFSPTLAANTGGDGVVLLDSVAATSGNQQFSPRTRWTGQGWKTTATAASQAVDWIAENRPIQGSTNPTSQLAFASQINAGGFTDRLVFDSGGAIYFGPSATAGSINGSTGAVTIAASNTNNNVNLDPIGTGIFSETKDVVFSDTTATRPWQGLSTDIGRGLFLQRSSGGAASDILSLGADSSSSGFVAGGSYGSLTATASGSRFRINLYTFGGSTWSNTARVWLVSTQAQTESVRGSQVVLMSTPNGTTAIDTNTATLDQDGSFKINSPTGGLGYGAGSGGAVTQLTNRTTGVTLNTVTGAITLFTAAGSASWTTFTVTDSAITARDTITVTASSGTTDTYAALGTQAAAGSFKVSFQDITGTTSESVVLNFTVNRGSNN